jgi:inner membrane protein
MLARAGLGRLAPKGAALLVVAANSPDIDIVSRLWGSDVYLQHHRGFTHSFFGLPVMAAASALVFVFLFRKQVRFAPAFFVASLGVLSHVLLDWATMYGIRLLTPLRDSWYRLDILPVIDLWLWVVLIAGFFWPLLARLVSMEIGAPRASGQGTAFAVLLFVVVWSGLRYASHERAIETLNAFLHGGRTPVRVAAFPSFTNPVAWLGLVESQEAFFVNRIELWKPYDPSTARVLYKSNDGQWIERARTAPPVRRFLEFSQFPLWRVDTLPEPEGARIVECVDLRFGLPGEGRFTATAVFDPEGRLERSWFQFGPLRAPRLLR